MNKNKKSTAVILLLLSVAILVSSCNFSDNGGTVSSTPNSETEVTGAEATTESSDTAEQTKATGSDGINTPEGSGAINSGSIDSGAVNSDAIKSGAIDSGAIDSGAVNSSSIDSGAIGSSGVESSAVDSGAAAPLEYLSLKLNKTKVSVNVGSLYTLKATIETSGAGEQDEIVWEISDSSVAAFRTSGKNAYITPVVSGSFTVSASVAGLCAVCTVTAKEKVSDGKPVVTTLDTGVYLCSGAVFERVNYGSETVKKLSTQYSAMLVKIGGLFPDAVVSMLPAPLAAIQFDTQTVPEIGRDQKDILADMAKWYDSSINFVDSYDSIKAHIGENLYFNTDVHWAQGAAYYAYTAFSESRAQTYAPLSSYKSQVLTKYMRGYMKKYLGSFPKLYDNLTVYMPLKAHTMTWYEYNYKTTVYDNCILTDRTSYLCFLTGDRPLIVIDVPENGTGGNGKSILVVKDSFGNAFVPFLTENYETIVVVDPRYWFNKFSKTVQVQLADYEFDDVLFVMNIQKAHGTGFMGYIKKMFGIK